MQIGEKYILTKTPSFSAGSRNGWEVEVFELLDEQKKPYLAFRDGLGVSWPVNEYYIR